MPTYLYSCVDCGEQELVHGMNDTASACPKCGKSIQRLWVAPKAEVFKEYFDEHLNAHITSASQRKELMKARGLVEGRSSWDRRVVENTKRQADTLGISVSELHRRFERQRIH